MKTLERTLAAGIATLLLSASASFAQNVVGTAVLDGRDVILYQDQTWAFKQAGTENCELINKFLSFCGDNFIWRKNPPPNQAVAAQYTPDPQLYLQYIPENIGTTSGVNYGLFREAALQYAANAEGKAIADVPVLLDADIEVSGFSGKTLVYPINFNGTNVVFQNTMVVQPSWSIQIQTYEIGVTTLTEKHKKHHAESLKLTKLGTP